ncbi:MAG: D-glycero-alpha-D-manno-heptose-1,7-bisphosphate 7-phosphatase [Polyangiales bacterium]
MRPAVFLDRDGTLNHDAGYTVLPEELRLFDDVIEALTKLKDAGYLLLVVTNQSGIGRGYYDAEAVDRFHAQLNEALGPRARVDAFYYSSHAPGTDDPLAERRRKPNVGMFEQACRDHQIDVARSWMIGDRESDLAFAARAGLRAIFVRTGEGAHVAPPEGGDFVVADTLLDAAARILHSTR